MVIRAAVVVWSALVELFTFALLALAWLTGAVLAGLACVLLGYLAWRLYSRLVDSRRESQRVTAPAAMMSPSLRRQKMASTGSDSPPLTPLSRHRTENDRYGTPADTLGSVPARGTDAELVIDRPVHRCSVAAQATSEDAPWLPPPVLFRDDEPVLFVVRCRGVQLGEHNQQINVYAFRIKRPEIDFSELLCRPDVREALIALSGDPEDKSLRRAAERALRAGSWRSIGRTDIDLGAPEREKRSSRQSCSVPWLDGTVIIRDCESVQVGNRNIQRNRFKYVCRNARVDAKALLERSPKIASIIVDAALNGVNSQHARALDRATSEALERSTMSLPNRERSISLEKPAERRPRIRHADGVSIGPAKHLRSETRVRVDANRYPSLQREYEKLQDGYWQQRAERTRKERTVSHGLASTDSATHLAQPFGEGPGCYQRRLWPPGDRQDRRIRSHAPTRRIRPRHLIRSHQPLARKLHVPAAVGGKRC